MSWLFGNTNFDLKHGNFSPSYWIAFYILGLVLFVGMLAGLDWFLDITMSQDNPIYWIVLISVSLIALKRWKEASIRFQAEQRGIDLDKARSEKNNNPNSGKQNNNTESIDWDTPIEDLE